ncbi:MAG: DUF401 family protein, partial [Spirochaetaceae bacterium]|nr:DUF401 family protein [Spirochaetaceae bacterium]
LFGGTIVFALWIGIGPLQFVTIAAEKVITFSNFALILLVCLVMILSGQLKKNGLVGELVTSIRGTFSSKASLAILPAVIGLLPMPGGALFSAPLLDNFDTLPGVNQETKTRINYWFRHVWEYAWPLYPGIIFACDISGIELWMAFLVGIPVSFTAILTGLFVFLSKIPKETSQAKSQRKLNRHFSIIPFLPIIIVVVTYFIVQFFIPAIGKGNQYLPMVISLVLAILTVQIMRPLNGKSWKDLLLSKHMLKMAILIVMIRIYGAFIETDLNGVSVVQKMTDEMQSFGIPVLSLIILLPFISGMTMGISVGFVGASIPVVVAALGNNPSLGILLSTVMFAYTCGFMGTMLSPLHVCLIVTCDYYESSFLKSLKSILFPAFIMISFAFVYMQLLQLIIP